MRFSYYKIKLRNFSYFIKIMDENFRFIQVLDELKEKGIITDYVQAANDLGTNKAGISDIKSGRKKLSIELFRRLKLSYPTTNIEWIIMGEGDAFVASKTNNSSNPSSETSFFIEKIAQQAEEIGILKQTIVQLKQESAGRVSGAESSTLAGVG